MIGYAILLRNEKEEKLPEEMGPPEILRDYKEQLREELKEKLKVQSNAYQAIVKELKDWYKIAAFG